jgi:hypothetical protein
MERRHTQARWGRFFWPLIALAVIFGLYTLGIAIVGHFLPWIEAIQLPAGVSAAIAVVFFGLALACRWERPGFVRLPDTDVMILPVGSR